MDGNVVLGCEDKCINVNDAGSTLLNNFIRGNGPDDGDNECIEFDGDNTTASNNMVMDCDVGLRVRDGNSDILLSNNTSRDNDIGLQVEAPMGEDVVFRKNIVLENDEFDIEEQNSDCGTNKYQNNTFETTNDESGCVR